MSVTFTKLFSSLTESTIWQENDQTVRLWISMLAMSDYRGRVSASIPGLASRARISVEATEEGLKKFLSPDKFSRTKTDEGRRIREIDGGWLLINYEKYRSLRDEDLHREQKRDYMRNRRAAAMGVTPPVPFSKEEMTKALHDSSEIPATAPVVVESKKPKREAVLAKFEEFWAAYPKKKAKGRAETTWANKKLDEFLPQMLEALEWQRRSEDWQREGGRFIPHPTTYLNGKCWLDKKGVATIIGKSSPKAPPPLWLEDLNKLIQVLGIEPCDEEYALELADKIPSEGILILPIEDRNLLRKIQRKRP